MHALHMPATRPCMIRLTANLEEMYLLVSISRKLEGHSFIDHVLNYARGKAYNLNTHVHAIEDGGRSI